MRKTTENRLNHGPKCREWILLAAANAEGTSATDSRGQKMTGSRSISVRHPLGSCRLVDSSERYDEISPSNRFPTPTKPHHTSYKLTRRQNKSKVAYPSADITMENRGTPQQDRWTNRWCQRSDLAQRRCDVAHERRTNGRVFEEKFLVRGD